MPSAARNRKQGRSKDREARRPLLPLAAEACGLLLLGTAALAALALLTYSPQDPVLRLVPVANRAGAVGASLAGLLHGAVGWGSGVVVLALAVLGIGLVRGAGLPALASRFWLGAALLLLALAPAADVLHTLAPLRFGPDGSGRLGDWLARGEMALFSAWGALLVNLLLCVVGGLSLLGVPSRTAAEAVYTAGAVGGGAAARAGRALAGSGGQVLLRCGEAVAHAARSAGESARSFAVWRERRARRARVAAARDEILEAEAPLEAEEAVEAASDGEAESEVAARAPRRRGAAPTIVDHAAERKAAHKPQQETFAFSESGPGGPYTHPDIAIFHEPPEGGQRFDRDSLVMKSRILEKKLSDFGVHGSVVRVHPGPVITMYEYAPASGIKVNRIVSLADDLALALRALSVRIIAPLPGKAVVGIEVPNPERETVYIRELLESESFRGSRSRLTVALGKDIFGNPVEADLARMPHLLVAGATGTGKSVFLNSLLCSILFRATPDELRLLLIDPKLLELSVYEGIPHLIADVVTNPKRAAAALNGIVQKMEERYRLMQALTVRSIDQYNQKVEELLAAGEETVTLRKRPGEEEAQELPLRRLPYILVVIDELADLMVVSARDVEEALQRLAQMARAAGIHLVLATQRPSVDVLTGVIKANFPARISFQVSSRTDSRTVLDQNGAEHLLGQGDMLFLPPGTSKLQRLHGSFVSEKEVTELARFLREQGEPEFDETLTRLREESEEKEARGEEVDDLYDRAIAIVAETRNASISYLQRRLKVGYNRAARMIEQMEEDGIVGPADGPKGREVFARAPEDGYE